MWLISLDLDLKTTVLPIFSRTLLRDSLWGHWSACFSVVPQYCIFFHRLSRDLQHARYPPGACVAKTVCIFSPAPSVAALLGVGWQGISYSLVDPGMSSTVGIFLVLVIFNRCSPFVDLFHILHQIKHILGIYVSLGFKIPYLWEYMGIAGLFTCFNRGNGNLPLRWENWRIKQ